MAIPLKKPSDIEKIRKASQIVAETLNLLSENTREGVSLKELDKMAEDYIRSQGGRPSFKGLYGFPSTVCTSKNEVIIHGIPTDDILKNGDIIGYDVGVEIDGWYGDSAITVGVGEISKEDSDLIDCAKDALYYAIDNIKVGMRFKELSLIIEEFIRSRGYVPLDQFCGHGIGRKPHEEPEIPNYLDGNRNPKQGPKIKNGMVFCLEPMICQKNTKFDILSDKWSVVSKDKQRGSHYEHTIAIINNKVEILTQI
jgi:methionyl aminopeptidase